MARLIFRAAAAVVFVLLALACLAAPSEARALRQVGVASRFSISNQDPRVAGTEVRASGGPSSFFSHLGFNGIPSSSFKPRTADYYSNIAGQPRYNPPF
ncbi:hypothetical protein Rsub_06431 [Raphidocelis subcapitata]|uniref:Uncharacterized protein n=1 Tax=Raphidocelis subcapitata TaxID=307507 RepID=A0A2V0P6A2_9CHLO|nr:hypothetical protein Rsub_06431 [Raphidocelis subcapitata]|eukprot:GBF93393.1 hypothetical protein Rsub_06431 [Raphidocelis subcapitata]